MRHPSVLAIGALVGAGLIGAGCGSSSSTSNAGGYPAASSSATQSTPASPAAASASGSTTAGASSSASGTAVGTLHTDLGTVLVAGPQHLTVYLFEADKGATSNCSGACAQVWPPVTTTGSPQAEASARAADLGTTTRSDGTKQLTYKGHPLYYYVTDHSSGETTGEGVKSFGAPWYVLAPNGKKIDTD